MCELREESNKKARDAGHVIRHGEHRFEIIANYPPRNVPPERWKRMCKIWNTDKWFRRSEAGRNNRQNDLSRHTGGSMGFDEHRIRLEKQKGGSVSFEFVFVDTHATKETKKRLHEGEININDLDQLEFVTPRLKESFTLFHKELEKEYALNNNQNLDQYAVWERLHPECQGRMFGIGSSYPRFVVTGSYSYGVARQSQKVNDVRAQLEQEKEAHKSLEDRLEQMEKDAENERAVREKLQNQMEQIMKKFVDNWFLFIRILGFKK